MGYFNEQNEFLNWFLSLVNFQFPLWDTNYESGIKGYLADTFQFPLWDTEHQ